MLGVAGGRAGACQSSGHDADLVRLPSAKGNPAISAMSVASSASPNHILLPRQRSSSQRQARNLPSIVIPSAVQVVSPLNWTTHPMKPGTDARRRRRTQSVAVCTGRNEHIPQKSPKALHHLVRSMMCPVNEDECNSDLCHGYQFCGDSVQ